MEAREIILHLAIKYSGDWDKIYQAIKEYEKIDNEEARMSLETIKSKTLTILDDSYPNYLKNMYKPPFALFYYGDISLIKDYRNNIAIIGSRKYSLYGKEMTDYLVKDIRARYNVVSGMAIGIDSIAHRAAIENGGKTIAVLGSGIDYCYPERNIDLYKEIKTNHLLISEYPNRTPPTEDKFPARNRLISSFSNAILVTQAKKNSGTMITVEFGLQSNKDVMCVPYLANEKSACNSLIANGAYLVETGQDIIDIMEMNVKKS